MLHRFSPFLPLVFVIAVSTATFGQDFVNWETPHVHPLDITPDGLKLVAVNTPDNRLEIFDLTLPTPVRIRSIPVGLDPVTVRVRSNTEAWVVNHISDSLSVVNLVTGHVTASLRTDDEPCDVVFAGIPERAYVSCSQANTVLVFAPANIEAVPTTLAIEGEDPRAMAVSSDGSTVYVAVFESGNRTTILGGGRSTDLQYPPNVVNDTLSPYFNSGNQFELGVNPPNPPPNSGASFNPPIAAGLPPPPRVGLIVRKDSLGRWMDDNNHEWTHLVSGPEAARSGRPVGWDLLDHDVALIDTATHNIRYATGVMNLCMAVAVNPATGAVSIVGTEATNEIRFEPVLNGRFIRAHFGLVDTVAAETTSVVDLNPHLAYSNTVPFVPIAQAERDRSIGDPRGIAWDSAGDVGYVTGMGSNNVVVVDASGARLGGVDPIAVGEGPTGIVLDEVRKRLYVLNKFAASISIIDELSRTELLRIPFPDPSPTAIKIGRKHLYDTHRTSGLGQASCASCHIDARMDRLSWDLGNPEGDEKPLNQLCISGLCEDWHPMKGPMTTQTLQDIIGKEPYHWRGDRDGLEEFAGAFEGLLGDDAPPPPADMQEFEDFLATIYYPPNPFRNFDNSLPADLPLPGHFTTGRFAPEGQPMANGDAARGLLRFRTGGLDGAQCVTCHTLPTGMATDGFFTGNTFHPLPPGPEGERHHALVAIDGSTNVSIKVPQLRNLYDKIGFETTQTRNLAGFGFLHDGSVDSLARFTTMFNVEDDQDVADQIAFMLSFAGSDLPQGSPNNPGEPPGTPSQDSHAAVGRQTTLVNESTASADQLTLIADMVALAESNKVGLIVKARQLSLVRGYRYNGGNLFQSDRVTEVLSTSALRASAALGSEITYTIVPKGSETRIGIDRDRDGYFDLDEIDGCSDPADPSSVPPQCSTTPGACCGLGSGSGCIDGVPQGSCEDGEGVFQGPNTHCAERCDFADNDCDLSVDEDFPELGSACTTGIGQCQTIGTLVCAPDGSGSVCNAVAGSPTTETCDGLDNNCNGQADETFPSLGAACVAGTGICATKGVGVCAPDGLGVKCDAVAGNPQTENCSDGLDNDCDGVTDENDTDCGGCGACRLYGDVSPTGPTPGDCLVELSDIICILNGYLDISFCPTGDIAPCGGDGIIELADILADLNAYGGIFACEHPCPP